MEHQKERKKLYNRMTYALFLFLFLATITVGGFYDGMLLGIALKPLVYVFIVIEVVLIGIVAKFIMDEEKLEAKSA